MRFRTQTEANAFVKGLLKAKAEGKREYLTAKLDTIPAWSGAPKDPAKPWVPDGSEAEAVYLSYLEATADQKDQAKPAKLAGVKLERIAGRLVDVRECKDGTCQVLFVTAFRDGRGEPAFRGPNIDKGILCYLAVGEGLGEPVDDIIARVPKELIEKLKAGKEKQKSKTKTKGIELNLMTVDEFANTELQKAKEAKEIEDKPAVPDKVKVSRGPTVIEVPSEVKPNDDPENRVKLR